MMCRFLYLFLITTSFIAAMQELPFTEPVVLEDKTTLSLPYDPIAYQNACEFLETISEQQRFNAYEVWLSGSSGQPDDLGNVGRIKACGEYIDLSARLPGDDVDPFFQEICARETDVNRSMLPLLRLLKSCGCDVARLNAGNVSILFLATDSETVEFLIKCGCDINQLSLPVAHQDPLLKPQSVRPIQLVFNKWIQSAQYEDQSMAEVVKTLFKHGAGSVQVNMEGGFLDTDIWSGLKYDILAMLDLNKIEELLRIHPPRYTKSEIFCISPFINIARNDGSASKEMIMLLAYYYQGDIYEAEHCDYIRKVLELKGKTESYLYKLITNKDLFYQYKAEKLCKANQVSSMYELMKKMRIAGKAPRK